jgi:hypothetical protein
VHFLQPWNCTQSIIPSHMSFHQLMNTAPIVPKTQQSTECGNLRLSRHLPSCTFPSDRRDFPCWGHQDYDDVAITSHNKQAGIADFSWAIPLEKLLICWGLISRLCTIELPIIDHAFDDVTLLRCPELVSTTHLHMWRPMQHRVAVLTEQLCYTHFENLSIPSPPPRTN